MFVYGKNGILSEYFVGYKNNQKYSQRKTVSFNLVQEFIEIEAWLLLTIFLYLHNKVLFMPLSNNRAEMFEKGGSSNRQKMNGSSFQHVLRQNLSRFLVFVSTQ